MINRKSISIPIELEQKIREIRAQLLVKLNTDISANQVIILLLEEAVKNWKSPS